MNDVIFQAGNLAINRFSALDGRAYEAGALDVKAKEMLGLVVGGSIVIQHLRRSMARMEELKAGEKSEGRGNCLSR